MALFQTGAKSAKSDITYDNEIASKIQQRRYQILVHSLLYYELDTNLISDMRWQEWAYELVDLQKRYPDIAEKVIFADAFRTFDGTTGFDLPYRDEQIVNIAYRLLLSQAGADNKNALNAIYRIQTTRAIYEGFYDKHPSKESKRVTHTQRKAVKKNESTKRKKLF